MGRILHLQFLLLAHTECFLLSDLLLQLLLPCLPGMQLFRRQPLQA